MKFSLPSVLLLAVLPLSSAFVSQSPLKNTVTPATSSKTELGMAWHEYVRNDPYYKNRNGEVNILKSELYNSRERLGNVQQPYGYNSQNSNLQWSDRYRSNDYYGPFASSDSARRYGYGNNNYAYGSNNMRDGYSSRVNNGRFPLEDSRSRTSGYTNGAYNGYSNGGYSTSRYGYNSNYNNNQYSRYGTNNYDYGYNNQRGLSYNDNYRQGPWLNSGSFPDENGSRYGYNDYEQYGNGGYSSNSRYGNSYSRNAYSGYGNYNSRDNGYGSGNSYGGRSGYGRSYYN